MPVAIVGEPSEGEALGSARRYYLSKRRQAEEAGDRALAAVWQSKQLSEPGEALPDTFPSREQLAPAGYTTFEDLRGASTEELVNAGLPLYEAAAALAALE